MILVTGATGMVGSDLLEQLLAQGAAVRVFTRNPAKAAQWGNQVECAVGDLSQPATLRAALDGVERLFLVTAATQQDADALQAARQAGVGQIVKLSTIEAGHEPMIGHGKYHREREELIRTSGLPWTFVRPTMFASTALDWAQSIKQQGVVRYPGGGGRVGVVDPWDVAAVAAAALTQPGHEGQAYSLTGPELLTMEDMVQAIGLVLGKPLRYEAMSDAEAEAMLRQAGLPANTVQGLVGAFAAMRTGRFAYLTNTVEKVTGHMPRPFGTWCRNHQAAFR